MSDKLLKTHAFTFNPQDNGGEQLHLVTYIHDNGDAFSAGEAARGRNVEDALKGGIWLAHELVLNSYGNSAAINFGEAITPANLRRLADELEREILAADARAVQAGIKRREDEYQVSLLKHACDGECDSPCGSLTT